jgi:multidrug resistance efflux pump
MKSLVVTLFLAVSATVLIQDARFERPAEQQSQGEPGRGQLELDECRLELSKEKIIMIGASQTGVLESVEPGEIGLAVRAGNTVARIRSDVMKAKLNSAKKRVESDIEIRYAEASNAAAKQRYRAALAKRKSYSDAELMNLQLEWKKTELQIEKAKIDREMQSFEQQEIIEELKNYVMTTPVSGEVAQVIKKTGESVRQGEDIMQIIDVSEIKAIGKLPVSELRNVPKGTKVEVRLLANSPAEEPPSNKVFKGTITFIDKVVSRVSQTCDIHAKIRNEKDRNGNFILKQGMKCRMVVKLNTAS